MLCNCCSFWAKVKAQEKKDNTNKRIIGILNLELVFVIFLFGTHFIDNKINPN